MKNNERKNDKVALNKIKNIIFFIIRNQHGDSVGNLHNLDNVWNSVMVFFNSYDSHTGQTFQYRINMPGCEYLFKYLLRNICVFLLTSNSHRHITTTTTTAHKRRHYRDPGLSSLDG